MKKNILNIQLLLTLIDEDENAKQQHMSFRDIDSLAKFVDDSRGRMKNANGRFQSTIHTILDASRNGD